RRPPHATFRFHVDGIFRRSSGRGTRMVSGIGGSSGEVETVRFVPAQPLLYLACRCAELLGRQVGHRSVNPGRAPQRRIENPTKGVATVALIAMAGWLVLMASASCP